MMHLFCLHIHDNYEMFDGHLIPYTQLCPGFGKTINWEKFIEGLIFLKKAGFDAVDFPLMKLLNDFGTHWKMYIEKALEASAETGIKFEICHLPYNSKICTNPDVIQPFNEEMHRAIDAAALLGVDYAVLHPNTTTITMEEFYIYSHSSVVR